ncbi:hypothetical protein G9A89_007650 [Geosiphon pyriformis]|nr:hypothetical protein G9A89_007650 [Geosiphon pyriformis]
MALLSFLFQLLSGCIGLKSVARDAVKLFCVEFASQESLTGAIKVAIGNEIFLTTLKIAWSSGVASVSSPSFLVALCNVFLDTSSDNIKSALGIFGVVTSIKLKPAGLWQYAVIHFKNTFSATAALTYWSVLVKKNSVRILLLVNQNDVIFLRDAFKAKLINLLFGCTAYKISELVSQVGGRICFILHSSESYQHQHFAVVTFDFLESLNTAVSKTGILHGCRIWWETLGCHHCYRCQGLDYLALEYKVLPPLPFKVSSNFSGGSKVFKLSFAESKSYAKAAVIVVPSVAAVANTNLDLGGPPPPTTTLKLPAVPSVLNSAVEAKLASLESHLGELFLLIKSLVESVGALVALVTKLLSTPLAIDALVKECVDELAKQNKDLAAVVTIMQKKMTRLEKICERACLEDGSDVDKMIDDVNNDDNNDKDFSLTIIGLSWEKTLVNTSKPVTSAKEEANPIAKKIFIQSLLVNHLTELV